MDLRDRAPAGERAPIIGSFLTQSRHTHVCLRHVRKGPIRSIRLDRLRKAAQRLFDRLGYRAIDRPLLVKAHL
jgi:hypothetical protein